MKYKEKIEVDFGKEFTSCHWERVRYFSLEVNCVWAFCFKENQSDKNLQSIQFQHMTNTSTAGRTLDFKLSVYVGDLKEDLIVHSVPYRHREWNHVCFTYSSIRKRAKFYFNGKVIKQYTRTNVLEIPSLLEITRSSFESSFTIAQEPDTVNGGYSSVQLFNGEISELNVWSTEIPEKQIEELSKCSTIIKGDVVAWDLKKFLINNAKVKEINDYSIFCKMQKQMVIFPQRRSFRNAKNLCDMHGGNLVLPSSEENGKDILQIALKHKEACLHSTDDLQKGKTVWLGLERKKWKWYKPDSKNNLIPPEYTNWDPNKCTDEYCGHGENITCPFMEESGFWGFGFNNLFCIGVELCTICEFAETPVFSIKGMCSDDTLLNWNYYIRTDDTYQIIGYDGYKGSELAQINGEWILKESGVLANTSAEYPLGRNDWSYKDRTCGMKSSIITSLTLSVCYPGTEFTCDSGQCIPLSKRCNQISECLDGSDEENCHIVHIPKSYNKLLAPGEYGKDESSVSLNSRVNIISIDIIDTKRMRMGITFELHVKWSDDRLKFANLNGKGRNLFSVELAKNLWLPSEHIIHDNAVLGEKHFINKHRHVGAKNLTKGMVELTTDSVENYMYPGSKTQLFMKQRFKILYKCSFDMKKFPFDKHRCDFIMKIEAGGFFNNFSKNSIVVNYAF
jgi:hypothetical protein